MKLRKIEDEEDRGEASIYELTKTVSIQIEQFQGYSVQQFHNSH